MKEETPNRSERSDFFKLSDEEIDNVHGGSLLSDVGNTVNKVTTNVGYSINTALRNFFGWFR